MFYYFNIKISQKNGLDNILINSFYFGVNCEGMYLK